MSSQAYYTGPGPGAACFVVLSFPSLRKLDQHPEVPDNVALRSSRPGSFHSSMLPGSRLRLDVTDLIKIPRSIDSGSAFPLIEFSERLTERTL